MVTFIFTTHAENNFKKLPKSFQNRILEKLSDLKTHDDILSVLKRLNNFEPATHRLRVGDYRLILALKKQGENVMEFWVLDAGHRKDVYR